MLVAKRESKNASKDGFTRMLLERFSKALTDAEESMTNEEHQQAMALYFDASQSADEMCERFLTLLIKTSPSDPYKTLLIEFLSWRLRYLTAQYDYHLAVAQTLTGLPRQEWIARLETILVLSQSLVEKLLPHLRSAEDPALGGRIRTLLDDWVSGIKSLVEKLRTWNMASAQASRVLEWAIDQGIDRK
jgi:hypothetical protein